MERLIVITNKKSQDMTNFTQEFDRQKSHINYSKNK